MADFTYLFADLVTNRILGSLPLTGVTFSSPLNGAGELNGTLKMTDRRVKKALAGLGSQAGGLLQPARTAIYVDYGGVLLWGGVYWSDDYDNTSGELTLRAQDFWSYLGSRKVVWSAAFTEVDQLIIAASLVDTAQAAVGGDIGVTVPAVTSGQNVTLTVDPNQQTTLESVFQTLATQSGGLGFDYMVDVAYDSSGNPAKSLTLSYPRRGRIAGSTGLVFDCNNRWAQGVRWQRDGTATGNTVYGTGAGVGPPDASGQNSPLRSTQSWPQLIDAGYPLLEQSLQRPDVISQDMLDGLTLSALVAVAFPPIVPQTSHSIDMRAPVFGSWLVGDDARLVLDAGSQDLFPGGADSYWRIVKQQVNVADEGVSTVELTWNAPPLIA